MPGSPTQTDLDSFENRVNSFLATVNVVAIELSDVRLVIFYTTKENN